MAVNGPCDCFPTAGKNKLVTMEQRKKMLQLAKFYNENNHRIELYDAWEFTEDIVEQMKMCGNCKHYRINYEYPCEWCVLDIYTPGEMKTNKCCNKWELAKK